MELPEEDELVLITIKKILPYGAFCTLEEYDNLEAFLHISEVAPRWIKNIHEFISEGERHVAKIYHVDQEKNQIDISLKRVNEEEKRRKLQLARSEKRAEKLLEMAIRNSKETIPLEQVRSAIEGTLGDAFEVFQRALDDPNVLDPVDLPVGLKKQIVEMAQKSIKKPAVRVAQVIQLTCLTENGVETIKRMLTRPEKNLEVSYLGAPRYQFTLTASTYKEGEKQLTRIVEDIKSVAEKNKCELELEKRK